MLPLLAFVTVGPVGFALVPEVPVATVSTGDDVAAPDISHPAAELTVQAVVLIVTEVRPAPTLTAYQISTQLDVPHFLAPGTCTNVSPPSVMLVTAPVAQNCETVTTSKSPAVVDVTARGVPVLVDAFLTAMAAHTEG